MTGIDTTDSILGLPSQLKAAGCGFCLKYSENSAAFPRKAWNWSEYQAWRKAGGLTGLVHETNGDTIEGFSADLGTVAGQAALGVLQTLGAPDTACVYVAVDFDASQEDIDGPIAEFFVAFRAVVRPSFLVGVYGSGRTCIWLKSAGLAHFGWLAQSTGWSGYEEFKPIADIVQNLDAPPLGLGADWNDCEDPNAAGLW